MDQLQLPHKIKTEKEPKLGKGLSIPKDPTPFLSTTYI